MRDDDELLSPRRMRPTRPRTRTKGLKPAPRPSSTASSSSRLPDPPIVSEGPFIANRAVVIGGSVAGIIAARMLSDYFARVFLIERDYIHDRPVSRKGAPQARHGHILLASGARVIGALFPEIAADMPGAGCHEVDAGEDLRWFHFGVWKKRVAVGVRLFLVNRMTFEHALRRQLARRANVEVLDDTEVLGYEQDATGRRIIGVRCQQRGVGSSKVVSGDLVIDASGRGSRTPRWLTEIGFPRVTESEVKVQVGYASRVYRLPRELDMSRLPMAAFPKPPETRRMGVMYPMGEGVLMATIGGWCRDHPPATDEGFLEFARTLPTPEFAALLEECKPAPAVHAHLVPSSLRHHYERMRRWPEGLVVIGDALCSFNPIYGQGMSVCALEVDALGRALARLRGQRRPLGRAGVARRLQRRVGRALFVPWLMAACEDLRYPEVAGARPFGLAVLQWYVAQVLELSGSNEAVLRRFMMVMNLVAGPIALLAPQVLVAVLLHSLRRRSSAAARVSAVDQRRVAR